MDTEYRKAANITLVVIGAVLLCVIVFKYALGALLPFLLAAVLSSLISPTVSGISKKTRLPKKLIAGIIILLIFAAVSGLLYLAAARLIYEAGRLLERIAEDPELINNKIDAFISSFSSNGSKFALLSKIFNSEVFKKFGFDVSELFKHGIESMISSVSAWIPSAAVNLVSGIPSVLFSSLVFLISAFYMTAERGIVGRALAGILPGKWQVKIPYVKEKLKKTFQGYFKAYFFIMIITFLEAFVGLSILKVNYSFLIAIVISIVDILPILGTGTVLIPWSAFAFFSSDARLGAGLLILYAVTLIVRQVIEPRIVGSSLGIHPLATLASVYLGLRFLGIAGLFIGPMVALLLGEIFFKHGESKPDRAVSISKKGKTT